MTWHMIHMMGLPDISRTSRQVSDHLSQKTVDVNHFEPTRSWKPLEKGLFIKNVRISYFTSKNTSKHIKTLRSISFQAQNHEPFQTTEQSLHPRKLTLTMATSGKGPWHPSFEFPAAKLKGGGFPIFPKTISYDSLTNSVRISPEDRIHIWLPSLWGTTPLETHRALQRWCQPWWWRRPPFEVVSWGRSLLRSFWGKVKLPSTR